MNPLADISRAVKRAKHFVGRAALPAFGFFAPTSGDGFAVAVRNALATLDTFVLDHEHALREIYWMALAVNVWLDSNVADGDELTAWAFASFLSCVEHYFARVDFGELVGGSRRDEAFVRPR